MALNYLLDTNICIYIAKHQPLNVLKKFETLETGEVAMSTITAGELNYGAYKSRESKKTFEILNRLTRLIPILPITTYAGKHYGEIRAALEKKGKVIGNNDLWIASHAMALNVILVTNNIKEFKRIAGLELENWVK